MHYAPIIQALISESNLHVDVLRLDLIDPAISGNKWFKLKYNIEEAKKQEVKQLLTFGGAFSNHIAATAAACKRENLACIGVIRGEKSLPLNQTLSKAEEDGMTLHFVSREMYDQKETQDFKKYLNKKFGSFYLVPEGGNNLMGVKGCEEICNSDWNYDYLFCACGTGTTYTGILASSKKDQIVVGINVLKGENSMVKEVNDSFKNYFPNKEKHIAGNEELNNEIITQHVITNAYAFKGYACYQTELITFKNEFEKIYNVKLDYIYTNKLVYALFDLIKLKKLKKKSRVLLIHSGGLQGNTGFENRYQFKPTR